MKKILILGGAGFLGSNLARRCLEEPNVKVTIIDSLDPRFHSSLQSLSDIQEKVEFIQGDIRYPKFLSQHVHGKHIIFNCAAQTSHTLSLKKPILDTEINCLGNLRLLEALAKSNPEAVVVYPSTATAIGKLTEDIADEFHAERPLEIYSANKAVAEKYYRIYHQQYGIRSVVLRFANLYGPNGKTSAEFGFMNYFIHRAARNQTLPIFGSGEQIRNVTYVEDASEIMWQAAHIEKLFGRILLATSPYHLSIRNIAETILRIFGAGTIEHIKWPPVRQAIEVGNAIFSSEKLYALTGWQAKFDLAAGLERTKERLRLTLPKIHL